MWQIVLPFFPVVKQTFENSCEEIRFFFLKSTITSKFPKSKSLEKKTFDEEENTT
jgi:hypothetical protein